MDRSIVSKSTFDQATDHVTFHKDKTPLERLNAACFIINNIFQISPQTKVNRTTTSKRKHQI